MDKCYEVKEGEGVLGGTNIGVRTTTLLSCIGIAMANKSSKTGGLYHYPAKALSLPGCQGTILQMINDLKPTELAVTPASEEMWAPGASSDEEDVQALVTFLKKTPNATISLLTPGVSATFYWEGDVPEYNGKDFKMPNRHGIGALDSSFAVTQRKLDGDAWFYGGSISGMKRYTGSTLTGGVAATGGTVENKGTTA